MSSLQILDGQVFQTSAWDRGMGKYSLSLIESIAKLNRQKKVPVKYILIFNDKMTLSPEAKAAIEASAPEFKHVTLSLQVPDISRFDTAKMIQQSKENERTLSLYVDSIRTKSQKVDYMILALFLDEVCAAFPSNATKTLLFYDLIPLLFSERYSKNENYDYYLARIATVLDADRILTISQTVADDLVTQLGIRPERVFNIAGAPIPRVTTEESRPSGVSLDLPYVLMASGNELRKNNINAVRGFEEYVVSTGRTDLRLVVTSTFDDLARDELSAFSPRLIFTGNVTESELRWLYDNSLTVLFVPEYEGLGLPVLEAAEANKPVVCSSIGAFLEMSDTAFYYVDHHDSSSIAEGIGAALAKENWIEKQRVYKELLSTYVWSRTAKLTQAAQETPILSRYTGTKQKLAILAPSPSGYSAIGKVVQQQHATLSEFFDVDYYLEHGTTGRGVERQNYLPYVANVHNVIDFNADMYAQYDHVLYHLGNSEYHIHTIKNALYLPGIAVIHDTSLNEIFAYSHQLGILSDERYSIEKEIDEQSDSTDTALLTSILDRQSAVVVHSRYAKKALSRLYTTYDRHIELMMLPTGTPKLQRHTQDATLRIGMAGVIHEGKGIALLEQMTKNELFSNVEFSLFGVPVASRETMDRLASNERITVSTNLSDLEFYDHLALLDVLVNYREEYRGETSLSTLEAMRMGVVPILRNIGWYSELPSSVAIKLDDREEIESVLANILSGKIDIQSMRVKSRNYVAKHHTYYEYAKQLQQLSVSISENDSSLVQDYINKVKLGDIVQ